MLDSLSGCANIQDVVLFSGTFDQAFERRDDDHAEDAGREVD